MSAAARLKSFRKLLEHARAVLDLQIGFKLWDGSRVPDDWPDDGLMLALADEGVVSALLRKRKYETLLNLFVAKRIDILNGDVFDIVERWPRMRFRQIYKKLSKFRVAAILPHFAFLSPGGPWPLEAQPEEAPSDGSRVQNEKNIRYHYDISNNFYALWLDREMVYSCGYCTDWDNDIDTMQRDKLEMICRKLRLKPGETLLDIGCGWGALCCYAAEHYGVNTHGITLSTAQLDYARAKAGRLALADRCSFELADYTTLDGQFDKIASVGMQEHVGIDNYPTYYATIKRLLKPDGLFLHHAITRPAKKDGESFRRKSEEFALITKYIFPGGELDHIGNTVMMLEQHGFEVHDVEDWREHYHQTCRRWHDRLLANYDAAVEEIGEAKTRLWLLYLGSVSIGFGDNDVRIYQSVVSHANRGGSPLPPTREDLYRDS